MTVAGVGFLAIVGQFVSPYDISKTAAARITKLDTEMFHHESCKPIYLFWELKRSKVKVPRHKNRPAGVSAIL